MKRKNDISLKVVTFYVYRLVGFYLSIETDGKKSLVPENCEILEQINNDDMWK